MQSMRQYLEEKGTTFLFDSTVADLAVEGEGRDRRITGVQLAGGELLAADCVVLAAGHSARLLYERLLHHGVHLQQKPIGLSAAIVT